MKTVFGLWLFVLNVVPDDSMPANSVQNLVIRFKNIWSIFNQLTHLGSLPRGSDLQLSSSGPIGLEGTPFQNIFKIIALIAGFKVVRA